MYVTYVYFYSMGKIRWFIIKIVIFVGTIVLEYVPTPRVLVWKDVVLTMNNAPE